jgi:hypothetical protein
LPAFALTSYGGRSRDDWIASLRSAIQRGGNDTEAMPAAYFFFSCFPHIFKNRPLGLNQGVFLENWVLQAYI